MKDLLRLLVTIAILAFVVRFALENVRAVGGIASGKGEAVLVYSVKKPTKVAIRATAIGNAEPKGRIILDIRVNGKSCAQSAEAYRKPSTPSSIRAELRCPERRLQPGDDYTIAAIARSQDADEAKVEVVVERVKE